MSSRCVRSRMAEAVSNPPGEVEFLLTKLLLMDKRNAFPRPPWSGNVVRFGREPFRHFGRPSKAENVVTPFTPLRPDFRDERETQWMQVVRKQTLGQVRCLFAIFAQVPKLDVAGSIPVSRSMFSIT